MLRPRVMAKVHGVVGVALLALVGCGGSGSETPPPLEPRPETIDQEQGYQPQDEQGKAASEEASQAGAAGQANNPPGAAPAVPASNF